MGLESGPLLEHYSETPEEENTAPEMNAPPKKESSETAQEPEVYNRARQDLGAICEMHDDPRERLAEIMKKIEPFFQFVDEKILPKDRIVEIRNALNACAAIQDKKKFLEAAM